MGTITQTDRRQCCFNLFPFRGRRSPEKCRKHAFAWPLEGEIEIFPHRQIRIDRGRLKLSANAELDDFILGFADEFLILAKDHAACHWMRLPADDVVKRGFACAIGPDHVAELVVVDNEVEIVQRFEAVVIDDYTLQVNDGTALAHPNSSSGRAVALAFKCPIRSLP